MRHATALRWATNRLLAGLLLTAVLARALIPQGFMPGPGGMQMCHGYVPPAPAVGTLVGQGSPVDGAQDPAAPHPKDTTPCPFAAAATAALPGESTVLVEVTQTSIITLALPVERSDPSGRFEPTRLPRGPPPAA